MSWITDHMITFFSWTSEISSLNMLMLKDQSPVKYQMLNKTQDVIFVEEALIVGTENDINDILFMIT